MLRLHIPSFAMTHSRDVHRATCVITDDGFGFRRGDALDFILDDGAADGGVFDGEGSAEAAALVGFFHGAEIDVADLLEEADAFVFDADAAEVAGVVVGDGALVGEGELGEIDLQDLVEEFDELEGPGDELFHAGAPDGIVVQEFVVLLADHRAAAAAGGDDVFVRLEEGDHPLGQVAGFGVEAVVEEGLAAAGLGVGEGDRAAEAFEDLGHGNADLGVELVGQAGDEECDVL